jgi:hypothetical protein
VAIGMNLRNILSGAVLALSMALALVVVSDGAQAKQNSAAGNGGVQVCNVNGNGHKGGNLVALDNDSNATGLKAMPGKGKGLVKAAANSPALSVCGVPQQPEVVVPTPDPDTGGDTGGETGGDGGIVPGYGV